MSLTPRQHTALLFSVFIVAICGLIYELIIGALSSYLWGNSVTYFSITIGLFMFAMGLGSFASRWINRSLLAWFILLEVVLSLVGGFSAAVLFGIFATTDLYFGMMVVIILITGGLVGMEVPLLTRLSSRRLGEQIKDTLANVLAFDYVGGLIGSLLFPLLLLPELGLLRTAFVTGLINLAIAALNMFTFAGQLPNRRFIYSAVAGSALVLVGGVLGSERLTSFLETQMYEDQIVYTQQTPYQRIVMTRWSNDVRLFLDGNLQFSAKDEYRYHEPLVHPALTLTRSRASVLVLGGGDGLVVRELLKYPDVQHITLVDIDPAMTTLARQHPLLTAINGNSLAAPQVELVHQDAFKFLEETGDLYGVIIIDLPDPNNEALGKLYSQEFYKMVQRHLAVDGVVVTQATSPYFARETYWCINQTLQSVGFQTLPYHVYVPSFGDWGFVLAAESLPAAESAPVAFTPQAPLRYYTPELFAASQLFDTDISAVPVAVSTLNNQAILGYYEKSVRRWR